MSQLAQYWLVGVHKERHRVLGYRIASLKHKKYIDLEPNKLKEVLTQQPNDFGNVGLQNGDIVGTQGQLDRYTAIRGYRAEGRQLVILQKIVNRQGEVLGFVVIDYRYSFCGAKTVEDIIEACANPLKLKLANASIVEQDGKKFIRAIQGEFNTVIDKNAPYQKPIKPIQIQSSKKKEEINMEIKKIQKEGFEYTIGAQTGPNGEYENIHTDIVSVRYTGFDIPKDPEEAKKWEEPYVLKPAHQIEGKPVMCFTKQFNGVKNKLIDLRGFKFKHVKLVMNMFKQAENCWIFIDDIDNIEIFKEMFNNTNVTIVIKPNTNIQSIQNDLKLRTILFRKLQVQNFYDDLVQNKTKGKGFGVVICCKQERE